MKRATGDAAKPEPPTPPIPPEKSSVTHHDLTLDGKPLHYTATAGTLLIRDGEDDHPYGSIFTWPTRSMAPKRMRGR